MWSVLSFSWFDVLPFFFSLRKLICHLFLPLPVFLLPFFLEHVLNVNVQFPGLSERATLCRFSDLVLFMYFNLRFRHVYFRAFLARQVALFLFDLTFFLRYLGDEIARVPISFTLLLASVAPRGVGEVLPCLMTVNTALRFLIRHARAMYGSRAGLLRREVERRVPASHVFVRVASNLLFVARFVMYRGLAPWDRTRVCVCATAIARGVGQAAPAAKRAGVVTVPLAAFLSPYVDRFLVASVRANVVDAMGAQ